MFVGEWYTADIQELTATLFNL